MVKINKKEIITIEYKLLHTVKALNRIDGMLTTLANTLPNIKHEKEKKELIIEFCYVNGSLYQTSALNYERLVLEFSNKIKNKFHLTKVISEQLLKNKSTYLNIVNRNNITTITNVYNKIKGQIE